MSLPFDPMLLTGPYGVIFLMLITGYVLMLIIFTLRKDILNSFALDRQDRQRTQELHAETIKNLKEAFENSLDKICKRAEESERLAEARYNIILNKTFSDKS